ncbi:hydrogenase-1 operon protein HyaE [Methylomagnum ishizawai]|uniref:Hydrogenase expression/formation protein n=1 Tax=Methylomagnum ishizawai TaxID=1760988 RepID=A0A1Y6D469_9GAMM|nr:hypothetical protein [Methylomagnum ishizawai]SMF97738.1 hydrogenase-1 operon protein HyaE [Methylomagnum ishizawai]
MNDDIPMDRLATLLARLVKHHGLPLLDETGVEVFAAASGVNLLFFPEDPERVPESWDVAAILPELLKGLPESCRVGVVPPANGRLLRERYGFKRWPALVFLRDGGYLGAIEGMKDWAVFLAEARQILSRPASRPPLNLNIPVAGDSPACH